MKRFLSSILLLAAASAQAQIAVGGATVAMSGGGATFPEPFANPLPGLWQRQRRNGNGPSMRRELGPAMGFVSGSYTSPIDGVTTTWAEKDSWTYTGEMYLTAGTTYTFATRIDDYATIAIDGKPILNQGGCAFTTGQYACRTTGWHDISIKIWDTGGGCGVCGGFTPGVAYNTTGQTTQTPLNGWTRLIDSGNGSLLKTRGPTSGVLVSAQMRESDPTVMDVDYIVYTDPDTTPTVNVRALAFEDGERGFATVVRPETFIEGTDANLGDGIAANVVHRLSWKVSSDWATDLAKVKFEVMAMKPGDLLLPMHFVTIPAVEGHPKTMVNVNDTVLDFAYMKEVGSDLDIGNPVLLDALLWLYSNHEDDLTLVDGTLRTINTDLIRDNVFALGAPIGDINNSVFCSWDGWTLAPDSLRYVFGKMGYRMLEEEEEIAWVNENSRLGLEPKNFRQYAVKTVEE